MHPATHLLLGWMAANIKPLEKRDRGLVTLAGVIPDVDGLGIVADLITHKGEFVWYGHFHHVLGHNIGLAALIAITTIALARRRLITAALAMASFHLHLLGDLVGSRGPDGYRWPINYFFPFSNAWQATWQGQWQLNSWPNILLTVILLAGTFYLAWKRGYSPIELVSVPADKKFVAILRNRFGNPNS
ncbi:MAG: metal-dependent hydrolase [Deltaproteobacteria bacterium]|nr:metal-dependent hydrolase [Deltaproteobacteria bacterium]